MGIYDGKHAELYDQLYAEKSYVVEARRIHEALNSFGSGSSRRLLDIACGTGSHAFELEKLGHDITATDISADMLAVARRRAAELSSGVRFEQQDMQRLSINAAPFDAVLCLFDAIGHVQTTAAIKQTFARVHQHLRKDGLLILEFWHAAAIVAKYDPLRVRRFRTGDVEILRLSETTLDLARQCATVQHSIYEFLASGRYTLSSETQTNRFFSLQEMVALLDDCRFDLVKYFAGYSTDEMLTTDTWHILLIARRRSE